MSQIRYLCEITNVIMLTASDITNLVMAIITITIATVTKIILNEHRRHRCIRNDVWKYSTYRYTFPGFSGNTSRIGIFFFTAREILVKFFRGLKCSAKRRKFLATQSGVVKE